jgi:hypothetical protein
MTSMMQLSPTLRGAAKRVLGRRLSANLKYRSSLGAYADSYLKRKGWNKSVDGSRSVGNCGPIPWITYPALSMLERVVRPEYRVFEYGSGNSSLWWSERVAQIASVEHEEGWAATVSDMAPDNLTVTLRQRNDKADPQLAEMVTEFFRSAPELPLSGDRRHDLEHGLVCEGFAAYALEIAKHGKHHFDIVVVDGMARSLTTWIALKYIKNDGIIIFDNSERWQYNPAFQKLADEGYKRIDFYGTGAVNTFEWCTSIFCRSLSWLPDRYEIPQTQWSDLGW